MKGFTNNNKPGKSRTWSDQDEAFFGEAKESTWKAGNGGNVNIITNSNSRGTHQKPTTRSQNKTNNNVDSSTNSFSFGKLKNVISSNTSKASSKFIGLADKYLSERNGPVSAFPSSDSTARSTERNNDENATATKQSIKARGPSSSVGINGQTIVRTLKNAVVSQVPLPCAYCNSIPLMYQCHPFWGPGQRICSTHDIKNIPKCLSCHKFQSKTQKFHEIGTSGSLICLQCAKTAILDNIAAREVFHEVLTFFQSYGLNMFNGAMHRIPIHLCTPQEMKKNFNNFKGDDSADQYGVCCWTEIHSPLGAAVGLIGAAGAAAARGIQNIVHERNNDQRDSFEQNSNESKSRNPFGGGRYVSISQIAALKGLPRLYLGSILAHEATHAWLALNPSRKEGVIGENISFGVVRRLPLIVEEGTCQLLSHLYLDSILCDHNDGKSLASDEISIIEYNIWGIENHGIYEYGEGYKQAARAYNNILEQGGNLQEMLEYISIHKSFPPC